MKKLAITVEVLGAVVVGIGVGIEVGFGAHMGFVLISGGSLVFCVGSLIWTKVIKG